MYLTTLSDQAQAAFDTLSPSRRQEFDAIRELLAYFLPALERAGFVTPTQFFSQRGWYRYYDRTFPYFIYFELGSTTFGLRIDVLLITLVVPV